MALSKIYLFGRSLQASEWVTAGLRQIEWEERPNTYDSWFSRQSKTRYYTIRSYSLANEIMNLQL